MRFVVELISADMVDFAVGMTCTLVVCICLYLLAHKEIVELFRSIALMFKRNKMHKRRNVYTSSTTRLITADMRIVVSLLLPIIYLSITAAVFGRLDIFNLIVACGLGATPHGAALYVRMMKRKKGGGDGREVLNVFRSQYITNCGDILRSLDTTAIALEESEKTYSSQVMSDLASSLRLSTNTRDVELAYKNFIDAYRTKWAELFCSIIKSGLVEGNDITQSLKVVSDLFKRASAANEKKKRGAFEGTFIALVLVPATYVGTLFFGCDVLGTEPVTALKNQIAEPLPARIGTVIVIVWLICFLYSMAGKRSSVDL